MEVEVVMARYYKSLVDHRTKRLVPKVEMGMCYRGRMFKWSVGSQAPKPIIIESDH